MVLFSIPACLKQGIFKPCSSSRNAEDSSSGGKEDEADVNDSDGDEGDDDNDVITANQSVDYIFWP